MSVSRGSVPRSTSAPKQVATYLDRKFGTHQGAVVLAIGKKGAFNRKNVHSYDHRGGWSEFSYEWPQEREQIVEHVLRAAPDSDVYVLVTLRFGPTPAQKGSCLGSEHIWADLDLTTDATNEKLLSLLSKGSFLVHSGRPGHLHVYIKLDDFYPPEVIEPLNRALMRFIGADNKWYEAAALRIPGTLNHKGRAAGEDSYPVVFENVSGSKIAPWTPEALRELLEPFGDRVTTLNRGQSRRVRAASATSNAKMDAPVDLERLPDDIPRDLRRLLGTSTTRGHKSDQSRSGQLYRFVGASMSFGYTDGEIMRIAMHHEPSREKWRNEGERRRQISRCIEKLRPNHLHVGRTCNQSGCNHCASSDVTFALGEVRSHFDLVYRSLCQPQQYSTDAKIFDALCQFGMKIGRLDFGVSQRQLLVLASISSFSSIERGLTRLIEAGYVKKIRLKNGDPLLAGNGKPETRAHRYRITLPSQSRVDKVVALTHRWGDGGIENGLHGEPFELTRISGPNERDAGIQIHFPSSQSLLNPSLDMWRYSGGLSATRLTYGELLAGVTSVKAIASFLGFSSRTIKRHLEKLEKAGLAEMGPDDKWVALERCPDDVAQEIGTFGLGVMQADRHTAHSEHYQAHLNQREDEQTRFYQELLDIRSRQQRSAKRGTKVEIKVIDHFVI